jgi:hypothetical protein
MRVQAGCMSLSGHKRKLSPANSESGLPSETDIQHSAYDFGFVRHEPTSPVS